MEQRMMEAAEFLAQPFVFDDGIFSVEGGERASAVDRMNHAVGMDLPWGFYNCIKYTRRLPRCGKFNRRTNGMTMGDMRLLAELYTIRRSDAACVEVAAVKTSSSDIAETWEDLMERQRLLASRTLDAWPLLKILTTVGEYLSRLGVRPADAAVRVLVEHPDFPAAARAEAQADGYLPVSRFTDGNTARLVCVKKQVQESMYANAEKTVPSRPGDLIVLVRDLPDGAASAIIRSCVDPRTGRRITNAAALSGCPLPLAVRKLCANGAEIRTDVLCPGAGADVMKSVAHIGLGEEDAEHPSLLLRLRRTEIAYFLQFCRALGLPSAPVVIGQVLGNKRLTCLLGDTVVANCGYDRIRDMYCRTSEGIYDDNDLREESAAEDAELPEIPEPVVLSVQGGVLAAETACFLTDGEDADGVPAAYRRSMRAVNSVLDALTARGVEAGKVSLSVSLSGTWERPPELFSGGSSRMFPPVPLTDAVFCGLCGVYRACMESGIPSPDPRIVPAGADRKAMLSVCAWTVGDGMPAEKI